jgi:hypothetical protein
VRNYQTKPRAWLEFDPLIASHVPCDRDRASEYTPLVVMHDVLNVGFTWRVEKRVLLGQMLQISTSPGSLNTEVHRSGSDINFEQDF